MIFSLKLLTEIFYLFCTSGRVQRFRILQSGWWKSFTYAGVISFCTTLPLLCYSSYLPGEYKMKYHLSQYILSFVPILKAQIN